MLNVALGVRPLSIVVVLAMSTAVSPAAERPERWIAILEDAPLAVQAGSRGEVAPKALSAAGARIAERQRNVRRAIAAKRGLHVTGSVDTLLNAVFFSGPEEIAAEVRTAPGVVRVVKQRYYKRNDAKAAELINAAAGWAVAGGDSNAGAGIKIGIVDSGIDRNHPALQDPSLSMPSGYPKCRSEYCDAFTSNKVIAARSYVELLAIPDSPVDSRPDDYSPRDRVGHGTAIASVAAGVRTEGPSAVVQGVAPKAWIGNYKVFGSPGVNDFASDEAVIRALDAAFNDGMDVVSLSLGAPALWAPEDRDTDCGSRNVGPCDPQVDAVENAILRGMVVVVDAGNSGDSGLYAPGLGTINTPGTSPNAITVGGSTNSHIFFSTVRPLGDNVPDNLKEIDAQLTNGLKPQAPVEAPLVDVATLNDDGFACQPLGNGTLNNSIALIQRGNCEFAAKLANAQNSGATAVIFYQRDGSNFLFPIGNLKETGIPAVLIGNTSGKRLKDWLTANPGAKVQIDPKLVEIDASDYADEVAYFSSYGPSIGSLSIKPELVAVATDMYMATQSYDPNGDMHDPSGFFATQGNSFASPQVAGIVALVKQMYPRLTPAQLKSAVVNTANPNIADFDENGNSYRARVIGVGAGKLDAGNALNTNVVAEPAVLSFGIARNNSFVNRTLRLTNIGSTSVSLRLSVAPRDADNRASVSLSTGTLNLNPGGSGTVTVRVTGNLPSSGNYEGVVRVEGGAVPLRIPYLYMAGDNVPFNIIPLSGDGFVREPGRQVQLDFLVVDAYGVPVVGQRVDFRATSGGGRVVSATNDTDGYGIASARVQTGNQLGYQEFLVTVGSMQYYFAGRNRLTPTIQNGGVSGVTGDTALNGIAAGSMVSIRGAGLSEARQSYSTPYIPLSLSNVSVSFDDTVRKTSYPGRVVRVSDSEVVVQAPWEIEGMDSIDTKVSIGYISQTDLVTVPVVRYAPGVFETFDSSGRMVALATDENGNAVNADNGVSAGSALNLLVNGLGPVNNRPASGEAPGNADSTTQATPVVTIGGVPAEVRYSGLHPTIPAVYVVSVTVPAEAGSGVQPVKLQIGDAAAKQVNTVIR